MYKIMRRYYRSSDNDRVIRSGLTFSEAVRYCQNPESSSNTCKSTAGKELTKKFGPWFNSYTRE